MTNLWAGASASKAATSGQKVTAAVDVGEESATRGACKATTDLAVAAVGNLPKGGKTGLRKKDNAETRKVVAAGGRVASEVTESFMVVTSYSEAAAIVVDPRLKVADAGPKKVSGLVSMGGKGIQETGTS